MATKKEQAHELYIQGNGYRKKGTYHEALNCYTEAIALDEDSPAVIAKQMLEEQFDFYYKDLYNP